MPDTPDSAANVTAEEFRALLKVAGLTISEDRAPLVMDELNSQLALSRTLDDALAGAKESDFAPFDPTFPKIDLEDEAE